MDSLDYYISLAKTSVIYKNFQNKVSWNIEKGEYKHLDGTSEM
jgi:hypothetical protein